MLDFWGIKILKVIMILMLIKYYYLKKVNYTIYNDVNKMTTVPLQLKINIFFDEIYTFTNNNRIMFIDNDDKELFRKCREIWNKITKLIYLNNAADFVETTFDDGDEFIMVDVHKNTSLVRGNYRNKIVIVLHSVINDYLQTSLVQHSY